MPCTDPDSDRLWGQELQKRLDERTAMLCEAMGIINQIRLKVPQHISISPELRRWWQAHKKWDAERRERGKRLN